MKAKRWFRAIIPLASLLALLIVLAPVPRFVPSAQAEGSCTVGTPSYSTIQSAVNDPACIHIDVPAGTFYENVIIARDLTIQGVSQGSTTVDGNNNDTVFKIMSGIVTLEDMMITHGNGFGGGINNKASTLTVQNCTISHNTTTNAYFRYGGGILNDQGTLTVINSSISSNTASQGAGIFSYGSTLTVNNSTISHNAATDYGGGINLSGGGKVTVQNSTISRNTAGYIGGGISNDQGTLTIVSSTLSRNTVSGLFGEGGGISTYRGALSVEHSKITHNQATDHGGGIFSDGSTLSIAGSTIAKNIPDDIYP